MVPSSQYLGLTNLTVNPRQPMYTTYTGPVGSIYHYISSQPNMTKFKKLVERANLVNQLSSLNTSTTIFIPTDEYIELPVQKIDNIRSIKAFDMINYATLSKRIPLVWLRSSPVSRYNNKNNEYVLITNVNDKPQIDGRVNIIDEIELPNSNIVLVDSLLYPESSKSLAPH